MSSLSRFSNKAVVISTRRSRNGSRGLGILIRFAAFLRTELNEARTDFCFLLVQTLRLGKHLTGSASGGIEAGLASLPLGALSSLAGARAASDSWKQISRSLITIQVHHFKF